MKKIFSKVLSLLALVPCAICPILTITSCGKKTIPITGISKIKTSQTKANINSQIFCKPVFEPSNTTQTDVIWTIEEGGSFATITSDGVLNINETGVTSNVIKVKVTSKENESFFATTTITIDTTPDTETYEEYIHDRTFSLLCKGSTHVCWGTCWILSDATPDNLNDYEYYIATNWHVIDGQQQVAYKPSASNTYFGDSTKSSGLDIGTDYTKFSKYELLDSNNFIYNKTLFKKNAIDFYVAKADFRNAAGATKTKLNKLNKIQQNYGCITQFAPTASSDKYYIEDTMYIAGFPVKNKQYATWEKHEIDTTELVMLYISKDIQQHEINESGSILDVSPQYTIHSNVGTDWMVGGASGSMLIAKFNGTYKVCGIYWGGWTDQTQTKFFPSFSIFNSKDKNFIYNYLF